MSRKVYLTIKTRTLVPVIATMKVIAVVEEGMTMERLVALHVKGGNHKNFDIEDSGTEQVKVEGEEDETPDGPEFKEQVMDFLQSEDSTSTVESFTVDDSK